jgi:hypothetical protein
LPKLTNLLNLLKETNWRGNLTAQVVLLPLFASDDARDFLSCG